MDKKLLKNFIKVFILTIILLSLSGCTKKNEEMIQINDSKEEVLDIENQDENQSKESDESLDENKACESVLADEYVYVHICGAVNNPGVYKLKKPVRVYEAVESAGGITNEGCDEVVNQAREIVDGEQIYIPTYEEKENGVFTSGDGAAADSSNDGRININTASEEQLMTLPGVGESKAKSIVDYRQKSGKFKAIEELKNVEGIKDGVFNKIKDKISI